MRNRTEFEGRRHGGQLLGGAGRAVLLVGVAVAFACGQAAAGPEPMQVTPPQPSVPEIFTLEGEFVRLAYNNEGFTTLGYRMAQEEVGKEWMLLMVGVTLRKPTPDYKLKREHLTVRTPDGKVIPLASQKEYGGAAMGALNTRAKIARDSINYFPPDATRACAFSFFAELGKPGPQLSYDEVDLSWGSACMGRLYFHVPGGIQVGQHWLDVKFANSMVQVPFRILTEEERKEFSKRWQDLKKQHEAALGQ